MQILENVSSTQCVMCRITINYNTTESNLSRNSLLSFICFEKVYLFLSEYFSSQKLAHNVQLNILN